METTDAITTTSEPPLPAPGIEAADIGVIVAYFVVILGVGIWAMCKTNRSNVSGFFLAGRDITWLPVGASLYSSNIGSGHFVGLAGSGASTGIVQGTFEWNAMATLLLLGWIYAPIYIASGVVTMPEYLKERFGGQRIRTFLSVLSLFIYIFTKISADLFAGAIFIQSALGWDIYVAIVALLAITALYTVTGGLAAVIYTDTAQTVVMVLGGLIMMGLSFESIGGYDNLEPMYLAAIPDVRPPGTTCGIPNNNSMHVFRDPVNSDLPWPAMLFGITINALWYWCTDQVIVQRTLAAKNLSHAKGGCVFAGLVKILPMYMIVMVGMISRITFPNQIGCATPETCEAACQSPSGCTNYAYAKLVLYLMPVGLKGLLLACMVAALMSSLTSVFNSSSTLFTCDIWSKIRPRASNRELMIVGRVFILAMVAVSVAWVPIIQVAASGKLFDYIQTITSFLAPPITAVFSMAVFWPRLNEPGAFWGLVLGMLIGVARMIFEFAIPVPACGEPEYRPTVLYKVHYLYFGMILLACTIIISMCVSLTTPPIDERCLYRLTWWTRFSKKKRLHLEDLMKEGKEHVQGRTNPGFNAEENDANEKKEVEKRDVESDSNGSSSVSGELQDDVPLWKKAVRLFCGLEEENAPQMSEEEAQMLAAKMINIDEEKWPAIFVNIGGIFMCCAGVFLFGFYA